MGTMVLAEKDIISTLNDLIALDFDAIEAYEAAIARLSEQRDKNQLRLFMADHKRHTVEVGGRVTQYGGIPTTSGDIKRVLTKGKVVLAGLAGDKAILAAMRSNEDDTNTAYENAIAKQGMPENCRELMTRNLADERRHRQWIVDRLQAMDVHHNVAVL